VSQPDCWHEVFTNGSEKWADGAVRIRTSTTLASTRTIHRFKYEIDRGKIDADRRKIDADSRESEPIRSSRQDKPSRRGCITRTVGTLGVRTMRVIKNWGDARGAGYSLGESLASVGLRSGMGEVSDHLIKTVAPKVEAPLFRTKHQPKASTKR
jgi:hypothetical protein